MVELKPTNWIKSIDGTFVRFVAEDDGRMNIHPIHSKFLFDKMKPNIYHVL